MWTSNQKCCISISAVPLPPNVICILEKNSDLIKTYDQYIMSKRKRSDITSSLGSMEITDSPVVEEDSQLKLQETTGSTLMQDKAELEDENPSALTDRTLEAINKFKEDLISAFEGTKDPAWRDAVQKIWSFGPRRFGSNILLNRVDDLPCSFWDTNEIAEMNGKMKDLLSMENSFVNGFQLATLAGPLCDEPMMGVAFVVSKWELNVATAESDLPR